MWSPHVLDIHLCRKAVGPASGETLLGRAGWSPGQPGQFPQGAREGPGRRLQAYMRPFWCLPDFLLP